jgi:hypothetical protein
VGRLGRGLLQIRRGVTIKGCGYENTPLLALARLAEDIPGEKGEFQVYFQIVFHQRFRLIWRMKNIKYPAIYPVKPRFLQISISILSFAAK